MDRLIAFYNAQHGSKKEFIFNYDGIEEHCFFAESIIVSAIRELDKIVGYSAEVKLGCIYQTSPYQGVADVSDTLEITPKDKIEHKIDWNTKMVSMIFNGRQETYTQPTETFTVNLVGTKESRDKLIRMFNLHGSIPFTFTFNGQEYQVRFPDAIEIVDKRIMQQIQGFESSFELEVVKTPNDGTFYEETSSSDSPAIILREKLSLYKWYENGCVIDGISYKDNLKVGLQKLQRYSITNMERAFAGAKDIMEIPELETSQCRNFSYAFFQSSVRAIHGLDFSSASYVDRMFYESDIAFISCPLVFPVCVNAKSAFCKAKNLKTLSSISMPKVTDAEDFFFQSGIMSVGSLNFPSVQNVNCFFYETPIERVPTMDFHYVTDARSFCSGCGNLKSVYIKNCNSLVYADWIFCNCYELVDVVGLNLTKTKRSDATSGGQFRSCRSIRRLTLIEDAITDTTALMDKYYDLMFASLSNTSLYSDTPDLCVNPQEEKKYRYSVIANYYPDKIVTIVNSNGKILDEYYSYDHRKQGYLEASWHSAHWFKYYDEHVDPHY